MNNAETFTAIARIDAEYQALMADAQGNAPMLCRELRRMLGNISQRKLAEMLDSTYTHSTISKIESGDIVAGRPFLAAIARLWVETSKGRQE